MDDLSNNLEEEEKGNLESLIEKIAMYKYMLVYAVKSTRIVKWSRRKVRCQARKRRRRKRSKRKKGKDTLLRSLRRRAVITVLRVKLATSIRRSSMASGRKNPRLSRRRIRSKTKEDARRKKEPPLLSPQSLQSPNLLFPNPRRSNPTSGSRRSKCRTSSTN